MSQQSQIEKVRAILKNYLDWALGARLSAFKNALPLFHQNRAQIQAQKPKARPGHTSSSGLGTIVPTETFRVPAASTLPESDLRKSKRSRVSAESDSPDKLAF